MPRLKYELAVPSKIRYVLVASYVTELAGWVAVHAVSDPESVSGGELGRKRCTG